MGEKKKNSIWDTLLNMLGLTNKPNNTNYNQYQNTRYYQDTRQQQQGYDNTEDDFTIEEMMIMDEIWDDF